MRVPSKLLLVMTLGVLLGFGCHPPKQAAPDKRSEQSLQLLLDQFISTNPAIAGVALHVELPRKRFSWSGASGVSDLATGDVLSPDQPVRIASNTKTFVATAILRLWEDGLLDLDESIAECLSPESMEALTRGGYAPRQISVRHLLTHTSGLYRFRRFNRVCSALR